MDDFQRTANKEAKESGFLEAKTTQRLLRRLLPTLEEMSALGNSSEEMMSFAVSKGATVKNAASFRTMFWRARKAGPLVLDSDTPKQTAPVVAAASSRTSGPVRTDTPNAKPKELEKEAIQGASSEPVPVTSDKPRGPLIVGRKQAASTHNATGNNLKEMMGDTYGKV